MPDGLAIAGACAIFFGALALERALVDRAKRRVRLRICVTGTRGKSSVTRLVAAGLRAGGLRVLAKATGTEARLIMPDGSEKRIDRRGGPRISEQGRLLRRAAAMGADAIVFEVMSTRPETQEVETGAILEPGILAVTNARRDHLPRPGATRSDVGRMLALSVPRGGAVYCPAAEVFPELEAACIASGARLVAAAAEPGERLLAGFIYEEFEPNAALALAVCAGAGVPRDRALEGMRGASPDPGRLVASRLPLPGGGEAYCVSAFAANDPESTLAALERSEAAAGPAALARRAWIFNVRRDRGERTEQWLELFEDRASRGLPPLFDELFAVGDPGHGRAAAARLARSGLSASFAARRGPEALTSSAAGPGPAFVFGLGNIAGEGRALAEYWLSRGRRA